MWKSERVALERCWWQVIMGIVFSAVLTVPCVGRFAPLFWRHFTFCNQSGNERGNKLLELYNSFHSLYISGLLIILMQL